VGTENLLRWLRAAFLETPWTGNHPIAGGGQRPRLTFAAGDAKLLAWMADNAYVTWIETDRP
jgi:hypothetical protein